MSASRVFVYLSASAALALSIASTSGAASAGAAPMRGAVISSKLITTITISDMERDKFAQVAIDIGDQFGPSFGEGPSAGVPQCNVALYRIVYHTVGVMNEPAVADEGLFVPLKGCPAPSGYPLIGYAHGTNVAKSQVIWDPKTTDYVHTAPDQSPNTIAAIFAAHGYVVSATDYLGLGISSYKYHPYLNAESEATSVVDAMRAARIFAAKNSLMLNGQVFLTGHSQGGQSALAAQRAVQRYPSEFTLLASAPSSGPYALTDTFEDEITENNGQGGQDSPVFATYAITGYQKTYQNIYTKPTEVFKYPYVKGIDNLLPVANFADEDKLFGQTLPLALNALIKPSFANSFLTDPTSGARVDTAKSDLLQNWSRSQSALMFLCGGSMDPEVPFFNTQYAYEYFSAQPGNYPVDYVDVNEYVQQLNVPPSDYHVTVAFFCYTIAKQAAFDPFEGVARQKPTHALRLHV
jgi:pimeloyl-ACP methyl ester carboxylesterase